MSQAPTKSLHGLSLVELSSIATQFGEPEYRARQLFDGLYRQRVSDLTQITNLPKRLREDLLAAGYSVGLPQIAQRFQSTDGTERYLLRLSDQEMIETVWMPEGDSGEAGDGSEAADDRERATICISSQVGCAVNCQFCFTAKMGVRRNLSAGEIAGQVIAVLNQHQVVIAKDRINLVFMGMGEPFLNYEAFMDAVRLLLAAGISESRMTVSTSGIVPGILRFAQEEHRPKLAVSLNGPNDQIRESIMPINRKWNIHAVLDAVKKIPLRPRERITFEYVLLAGVNDRTEDAMELASLVRRANFPLKLNLIAWNGGAGISFQTPAPETVSAFQRALINAGVPAFIRRPRGRDIYAACGQLKSTLA